MATEFQFEFARNMANLDAMLCQRTNRLFFIHGWCKWELSDRSPLIGRGRFSQGIGTSADFILEWQLWANPTALTKALFIAWTVTPPGSCSVQSLNLRVFRLKVFGRTLIDAGVALFLLTAQMWQLYFRASFPRTYVGYFTAKFQFNSRRVVALDLGQWLG